MHSNNKFVENATHSNDEVTQNAKNSTRNNNEVTQNAKNSTHSNDEENEPSADDSNEDEEEGGICSTCESIIFASEKEPIN